MEIVAIARAGDGANDRHLGRHARRRAPTAIPLLLRRPRFPKTLEARATDGADDSSGAELRARGIATQIRVFRRIFHVALSIIGGALILVQFEVVRNVGVSLLASAGLAGVVLGFAAQRTIGNLFAGLQLSLTQPIRIDDVVIVEGEWGNIEEIQVDWSLPVEEMRHELDRIVRDNPHWDGKTCNVQVTDAKDRVLEVRALVSAKNSGALWNLRVDVRERLVKWLRFVTCLHRRRSTLRETAPRPFDGQREQLAEWLGFRTLGDWNEV